MPIQEQNIKFLASQVMDDVPEGGGAATGREIADGQMNNVFEDISDLDRAMGRFNLRKLFLAVRTLSADLFGGAKTVVTALPEDPAIGYTLFTTNDAFDTRDQAANRVEAYLFKAGMWHGALYENHIKGMRQIRVIQREGTQLPPRSKTLCLVQREGQPDEREQYVRVIDVSAELQTFSDDRGDFQRLIVTMDLSDALRFDFDGHQVSRTDSYNYSTRARLRDTTVADATRYYGAQYLAASAVLGDRTVRAQSMFAQLVPSAQSEEPLVDQPLNPEIIQTINAGARDVEVPQQAHTLARAVTAENRRYNWIETLSPVPAPNSYTLSYMAQGNWYTLTDDGNGIISGSDPSFGSGTIDYVTGSTSITLGALPDAGSQIIHIYGSRVHYEVRAGSSAINRSDLTYRFTLENLPAIPQSVTLNWTAGGEPKTATADASGILSGDGTGRIDGMTGAGELVLSQLPDRGTPVTITYNWYEADDPGSPVFKSVDVPAGATMTLPDVPQAGSARFNLSAVSSRADLPSIRLDTFTNSAGELFVGVQHLPGGDGVSLSVRAAQKIGSIAGAVVTLTTTEVEVSARTVRWGLGGWQINSDQTVRYQIDYTQLATASYYVDGASSTSQPATQHANIDQLELELTPTITDAIVPGSVQFILGGKTYEDRQGDLVTDIETGAGSALTAGTIDYESGVARITFWADGVSAGVSVTSLLTVYGHWTATEGFFRTALAPLKPESLQIIATTTDGELLIATSDPHGEFHHEWVQGSVDYALGTAAVTFGKRVLDSSLSEDDKAEPWYDPADVGPDGYIYKPRPIIPSTARYNAVAFTYIPLDANIVGIDAVRLPADGRVPIYRPGDAVMIMHTAETTPQTVGNGDTITTRPRLAWVRVLDANGAAVTEGYSLDRATGRVTFDNVAGIAMPVTVRHTVGDLRLVTDVQISGDIQLSRPLSHNYPAGSIVASCLIHGDRRARVSATWDQQTWNNTWSDSQQGSAATATLNLIDHPIVVTNEGCDTDRWVLRCISASANSWELISEKRGLVWSGIYAPGGDDIAPINPRTRGADGQGGVPYMVIPAAANGGGWANGNVVRINTVGAIADFWIARSIQQSDEPLDDGADGCEIYALGNIDRP